MPLPNEQISGYTYGDHRMWPDDERWELIDGFAGAEIATSSFLPVKA